MCGITGILYRDSQRPIDADILRQMAAAIAHRGPDGAGFFIEPGVGLAHRRLSIIDLEGGRQPLGNEDGSIQIVFNGEIYNYQQLRRDLEAAGHQFRTHSDTEVIVHAYEQFGDDCVQHLRGMFAFAIWDGRQRRMLIARDRVGIKPLYIRRDGEKLLFGSELKTVLAYPGATRELDPLALDEYLNFGMVPGSRSIFRGIDKLLPGHVLTVDVASWTVQQRKYWQLEFQPDESFSVADWQAAILDKLRESVRLHMVADVPVGAFLSGGIDSSVVTGLAFEAASVPLQTFSIGFKEARFNELPFARDVARHFGTTHIEEVISPDAASLLPQLAQFYDEPFADSSAIPTFLVSQLAAKHVKVVLSGDGGDEALGGYSRYAHDLREASIREHLPPWLRRFVLSNLARLWPKADWLPRHLRLKTFLTNLSLTPDAAYANTLSLCRLPKRHQLLSADLVHSLRDHDAGHLAVAAYRNAPPGDALAGMIQADMATLLPDDYLVKVDRASMANGLEVRPPLLDHEFLELCARVPSRWKIHQHETKWLLREVARRLVPSSIIDRPKQGFEIPLDQWLRGPLQSMFQELVLNGNSAIGGLIDQRVASSLLTEHRQGIGRHGSTLWSLLSLATWADRYLRDSTPSTQPAPEPVASYSSNRSH